MSDFKLPWRVVSCDKSKWVDILDCDDAVITMCLMPKEAAHIVHAVNNHDALVALLTRYRNETPLGNQPYMIAHEVDAALAKAKGEQP